MKTAILFRLSGLATIFGKVGFAVGEILAATPSNRGVFVYNEDKRET